MSSMKELKHIVDRAKSRYSVKITGKGLWLVQELVQPFNTYKTVFSTNHPDIAMEIYRDYVARDTAK